MMPLICPIPRNTNQQGKGISHGNCWIEDAVPSSSEDKQLSASYLSGVAEYGGNFKLIGTCVQIG